MQHSSVYRTGPRPISGKLSIASSDQPGTGTTPPGDGDVLRRAREGDHAAYRLLYERYVGRVFAIILRLEPDEPLAEELVQDTFVRAWRGLDGFRGDSALSTWLYRLAVNTVLLHRRATGRRLNRVRLQGDLDALPQAHAPERDTALTLALEAAIRALPEGARTVFVMHEVEGFQHAEIGELLGIAPGTSKAQLFRARRLLREALR